MVYRILGFNFFNSKAGKRCCTMQVARLFNDMEKAKGSVGYRCDKDIFLPEDLHCVAISENVGKDAEVMFDRGGYFSSLQILK